VALQGFVWTAEQADHSETMLKKHCRELWNLLALNYVFPLAKLTTYDKTRS
jgi:hypothetical protein